MKTFRRNYVFMKEAKRFVTSALSVVMPTLLTYDWAYAGSCAMFLHGVPLNREIHDIDIIVDQKFIREMTNKASSLVKVTPRYYAGKELVASYRLETINGPAIDVMFVKDFFQKVGPCEHPCFYGRISTLDNLLKVKQAWARPKDIQDVFRIRMYKMCVQ